MTAESVERRVQRRIKQHSNEAVAETHALEQRKDYRIDISSIQSTVAGVFSTLLGYVLRAEGRQGKVTFYFENTPDPMDVKAMAEAEGVKIANLKALKELRDMDGIEEDVYEDAVEQVQSPKRTSIPQGYAFMVATRQRACCSWIRQIA